MLRYHAKFTGGPWEAVQNAVMGSRMSKLNEANGFLSCPHKTRTARAPQILLVSQKTAQKEGAVRVRYAILLLGAPEFFYSRAAGGCLARTSQIKPGCCQQTQCKGGAMQNGTRKAYVNISLAAFDTTTTTSKVWSLYSFEGFLLYIKDIVKITKVTKY